MRKIGNFLTGRLFFALLLLLPISAAFVFFAVRLPEALAPFALAERIFSFVVALSVANERILPEQKTARLCLLLLLPWTGAFLCLCTRTNRRGEATLPVPTALVSAEYFRDGGEFRKAFLRDLKRAETKIYLEYYIIAKGAFFGEILSVLKEKAKAGLDVRIIYDDFGCSLTLPRSYRKTLEAYGIRCRVFRPVLFPSRSAGKRDHRKIAVVDDIAYTGGINLADEYVGETVRFGHWKDTAVRVTGGAAGAFEALFLETFDGTAGPEPEAKGDTLCTVYADKTDYSPRQGALVTALLMRRAKERLYLFTPYLSPDAELMFSLKAAAAAGTDVRIIVPHIPDKKSVFLLTRSYARELIASGVQIREYTAGFLHAKSVVADDAASVSSYNLDYRSMRLQAECGIAVSDKNFADGVAADFLEIWNLSSPPPAAGRFEPFAGRMMRLVSPRV